MTLIEQTENAIMKLMEDGKLPDNFEITRMNISVEHKMLVWGKVDGDKPVYYWWTPYPLNAKHLRCRVYKMDPTAIPVWNDEEGMMNFNEGLQEEWLEDLDIDLNNP